MHEEGAQHASSPSELSRKYDKEEQEGKKIVFDQTAGYLTEMGTTLDYTTFKAKEKENFDTNEDANITTNTLTRQWGQNESDLQASLNFVYIIITLVIYFTFFVCIEGSVSNAFISRNIATLLHLIILIVTTIIVCYFFFTYQAILGVQNMSDPLLNVNQNKNAIKKKSNDIIKNDQELLQEQECSNE